MSEFRLRQTRAARAACGAVVLLCAASHEGLSAQSTEEQRRRVAAIEAIVRATEPDAAASRPPNRLSPTATYVVREGRLVVRAEPELAELAGPAAATAWRIFEATFGDATEAHGEIEFGLQWEERSQDGENGKHHLAVAQVYVANGQTSVSLSWPAPMEVEALGRDLAWRAGLRLLDPIVNASGNWRSSTIWIEDGTARESAANALIVLATRGSHTARQCAATIMAACRAFLALDSATADFRRPRATPHPSSPDWASNLSRVRFMALAVRAGGPEAISKFQAVNAPTLAPRFAAAAALPADSLVALWRADFHRPGPPLAPRFREVASLLLLTVTFVAFAFRRPRVR